MKKILFALVALLTIFFSSCSNDEIEISTVGKLQDLTINIPTQNVYDNFNISEDFKNNYLSGSYNIGLYSFIYNNNGDLVASDSLYTQTFGKVSQTFKKLLEGDYTIITVEMLVNADNNFESDSWVLIGKDKLETLEIMNKNYRAYWQSAVGVATQKITISKNANSNIDLVPKGIGSIIDTYITNFDKSDYKYMALCTKDQPVGRYLAPSYTGDARFHYTKYNESNTWSPRGFVIDNEVKNCYIPSIYLLEEGEIKYCFGAKIPEKDGSFGRNFYKYGESSFTINDGKTYYGGFHYVGGINQTCEAKLFNSINEFNSWYKKVSIILDAEPYLTWGANASTIENYMLNCGMLFNEDGINTEQGLYWSSYDNPNKTLYYEYRFNTDKTNLQSVLMSYSSEAYSMEDVLKTLRTKYTDYGYDEELGGYLLGANETILLVFKNDSGFGVLYVPNTSSNARKTTRSIKNTSFINLLKKVNK